MALKSQADFGKIMGVTRQRVNQWVSEGIIELVRVPGKKRGFVDVEKARAAVEAARDPRRKAAAEIKKEPEKKEKSIFDEEVLPEKSLADMSDAERAEYREALNRERAELEKLKEKARAAGIDTSDDVDLGQQPTSLNKVKIFKELYQGKLAKLDYETKSGRLIPAEEIERQAFEMAQTIKSSLLALPHKMSARVAHITEPEKIEALLDIEIRQVLEELSGAGQ